MSAIQKRRSGLPAAFFLALAGLSAAQAQPSAPYQPPRLADGRPSLEGDWTNSSLTTFERPITYGDSLDLSKDETETIEAEFAEYNLGAGPDESAQTFSLGQGADFDAWTTVMRVGGQPRTSLITTPANGRVPPFRAGARPEPEVSYSEIEMMNNPETVPVPWRCLPNMTPNSAPVMQPGSYNNFYRIVQGPEAVAIMVQMADDVRIVRLGGRHRTDGVRPWMGDSIGRWEGDVLVVETTNFPRAQAFHGSWQTLKVTERFSRAAEDRLLYRFTVEDPALWDRPWGGEYEFAKAPREIEEYACHPNDQTVQGSLEGSRYEEAHPKQNSGTGTQFAP